jgi:hypothetical protein
MTNLPHPSPTSITSFISPLPFPSPSMNHAVLFLRLISIYFSISVHQFPFLSVGVNFFFKQKERDRFRCVSQMSNASECYNPLLNYTTVKAGSWSSSSTDLTDSF